MHTLLCVCPPRVESRFSPVLPSNPTGLQNLIVYEFLLPLPDPQVRSLMWGSEPSLQWVDFCGISVLQSVSHPPTVMGFDFTVIAPLLPSHCGFSFVFGCGVSFLVSSSVFLSMIVQQLVVILVFSQEGVRACPSALPSWFRAFHID